MPNVGEAWYEIEGRNHKLRQALDDSDRRVQQSGANAERSFSGRMTNALGGFGRTIGGIATVAAGTGLILGGAFAAIGGLAVKGAADAESMQASWETLLGSADAANARMKELKTFAAQTPFEIPEVMAASRQLQVFGGTALATGDNLKLVGDIASGTQQPFTDVAMWIGRTYDAMKSGQPFGEAAQRLQEMGALSGDSRRKLETLAASVKDGSITMDQAWSQSTAVFDQFGGQMKRQSQTLNGQISNMMDNIGQALVGVGEILLPLAKTIVEGINAAMPSIRDFFIGVFSQAEPILRTIGQVIGDVTRLIGTMFDDPSQISDFSDQFGSFGGIITAIGQIASAWIPRISAIVSSAFDTILKMSQAVWPVVADLIMIAMAVIQRVIEAAGPPIQRLFEWIARDVVPPLQEAFAAIHGWIVANWPAISQVIDAAAIAVGAALSAVIAILQVLWPIVVMVGRVVLPILGVALQVLMPILTTFFQIAAAAFKGIADIVTWAINTVVKPILGAVIDYLNTNILPNIELFGRVFSQVWTAVAGFFESIWNGILHAVGSIIGTIIGIIRGVVNVAAGIPGPWQEGAKKQAKALGEMEASARSWGTNTASTLTTSYADQRAAAASGAAATARAYGDAFAAQQNYIRDQVAAGLTPARGIVYATSPPPDPRSPLHDIDKWAENTADAYADAFKGRGASIATSISAALTGVTPPSVGAGVGGGGGSIANVVVNLNWQSLLRPTAGEAQEVSRTLAPELVRELRRQGFAV